MPTNTRGGALPVCLSGVEGVVELEMVCETGVRGVCVKALRELKLSLVLLAVGDSC